MALNAALLDLVLDRIKEGNAVVSLGYPDIIYPIESLRERLGDKILQLKYRDDSEAICKRHGAPKHDVPDAESLFECFGATLDVFDVVQERGCEVLVDLNHPVPANACGQFDFVLDVGTLEHCFNAPQALINMAALCKVGGFVMHENPFNWGNHGFWNLNPTLYHDFYTDNGFKVISCWLMPRGTQDAYEAPLTKRFQWPKGEANLVTVVQRVEEVPFQFVTQTKYRR